MCENKEIYNALVNLEEEKVKELVKENLNKGVSTNEIMTQLRDALIEIGNRYEREEYFVSDLIYSGVIMKEALSLLNFDSAETSTKGKVVIGTVYGDVHDIGKDLVVMLLRNTGFEVIDLGTSVEANKFVEAIKESGAKLVGMSCLITISFGAIADTVQAIEKAGIRNDVSIMVGGAPVTELVAKETGCDFYGKDAFAGVKFAEQVYSK
jgi:methylmalonyl-CoA mutase cobalamin-binding domain/chain